MKNYSAQGKWHNIVLPLISFVIFLLPEMAYASSMGFVVCQVTYLVQGEIASGLATIGICTLGAGACFGKVSWPMAVTVGCGISGLFGAANLAAIWAGGKC